jgi:hypothetical protein
MRKLVGTVAIGIVAVTLAAGGCGRGGGGSVTLATYTFDDLHAVADTSGGLTIDHEIVETRPASLAIDARGPRAVRLIEMTPPPDLDGRLLVWTARAKPLLREGLGWLEGWAHTPDGAEVSARSEQYVRPRGWVDMRVEIPTEKGKSPDRLTLNLLMNGPGKFWIESVKLESEPLPRGGKK